MSTKLQIALDDIRLSDAIALLEEIGDTVDIAEVGTPMMMEYGMEAVRSLCRRFPRLPVLCDAKIMDAGEYEAKVALDAGAAYVTVLGVTDDLTIREVAETAHRYGAKAVADMICVADLGRRTREMEAMGVDVLAVHTGIDQQAAGRTALDDLKLIRQYADRGEIAVAGGIHADSLCQYLAYRPDIVIVGGGICRAEDPRAAAREIKRQLLAWDDSQAGKER